MKGKESRASFAKEYTASKNIRQTDSITRHRIFNRVLEILSNPQIRHRQSEQVLPFILHEKTKTALMSDYEFSKADIMRLETEIFYFAEYYALNFEVVRNVPSALYFDLKSKDKTDLKQEDKTDSIFTKRAVPIPNSVINALVCEALEKEFDRTDILACDGFILRDGYIRLDLDERLVRRGFITPNTDEISGLISGLWVFRYPSDEHPFVLRSRDKNLSYSEVVNDGE